MTRPKKDEQIEKVKEAQPITLEEFKQKSDQVVVALTELKEYTNVIISGYVKYTSNLFRGSAASHDEQHNRFEVLDLFSHLNNTTAPANAVPARATTPGPTDVKKRKPREKKPRDPNAPKRPLTAYFLFAEHAREYIKKDLGEDTPNGDIQKEATRRWSVMPPEEKAEWKASYQRSYEQYKKDAAAYLASKGETTPPEEEDQEMADAVAGAADPEAETSSEDEGLEEATPKSPTPPPKAPSPPKETASKTPKTNKRRKAAAQNGIPVPTPAATVPAPSSPTPATKQTRVPLPTNSSIPESTPQPKESSPELKRKKKDSSEEPKRKRSRKSKGGEGSQADTQSQVPAESTPPAPTPAAEKKDKKRKRKSEAT